MSFINESIHVTIRGFTVYIENKKGELYDIFIPTDKYKLPKKEVKHLFDENDTILHIKKNNQVYEMDINDIEHFGTKL